MGYSIYIGDGYLHEPDPGDYDGEAAELAPAWAAFALRINRGPAVDRATLVDLLLPDSGRRAEPADWLQDLLPDSGRLNPLADWLQDHGAPQEGRPQSYLKVEVQNETHPRAPAIEDDSSMSLRKNYRAPSYGAWADFCRETGLEDLFNNPDRGLMRDHPGAVIITADHLKVVDRAMARWRRRHRGMVARFDSSDEESRFGRLVWLQWWMRYAVRTHAAPVICNF